VLAIAEQFFTALMASCTGRLSLATDRRKRSKLFEILLRQSRGGMQFWSIPPGRKSAASGTDPCLGYRKMRSPGSFSSKSSAAVLMHAELQGGRHHSRRFQSHQPEGRRQTRPWRCCRTYRFRHQRDWQHVRLGIIRRSVEGELITIPSLPNVSSALAGRRLQGAVYSRNLLRPGFRSSSFRPPVRTACAPYRTASEPQSVMTL
jgi:hypothetical protein